MKNASQRRIRVSPRDRKRRHVAERWIESAGGGHAGSSDGPSARIRVGVENYLPHIDQSSSERKGRQKVVNCGRILWSDGKNSHIFGGVGTWTSARKLPTEIYKSFITIYLQKYLTGWVR